MNNGFLDGLRKALTPPNPIGGGPIGPAFTTGRYLGVASSLAAVQALDNTPAGPFRIGDWFIAGVAGKVYIAQLFLAGTMLWVDVSNNASAWAAVNGPFTVTGTTAANSKFGYGAGAGSTVTQLTSRTTTVALARATGQITLFAATALAADVTVSFTLTNALIAATDILYCDVVSGAAVPGAYRVTARCGAGTAQIDVHNVTPTASAAETPVIQFVLIKGSIT